MPRSRAPPVGDLQSGQRSAVDCRDSNLANRSRLIVTTCETGEMAAIAGKLLRDMGFTNVHFLKGGTVAWKDAGYATYSPQAVGAGNNLCNKNQEELK